MAASEDERERALEVWCDVEVLSAAEQQERICALDPPFLTDALYVLLRDQSQALIRDHPQRNRQLAELALAAVQTIDPTLLGADRGPYLECDAWTWLANARRVACDLRGADEAL
ncbi:MAG: hypothetical protein GY856_35195, partial [bacterium]|nr:hypothetical protein [bacterium]